MSSLTSILASKPQPTEVTGDGEKLCQWYLYAIQTENNGAYVGISTRVDLRYGQHERGSGAIFTKENKPIRLIGCRRLGLMRYQDAELYENAKTLELAMSGRFDVVAGGWWCDGVTNPEWAEMRYTHEEEVCKGVTLYSWGDDRVEAEF